MGLFGRSFRVPQMDRYLGLVRALPRPSCQQTYRFAWFVSAAHSWYKHLPSDRKVPFLFYVDPYAGMNLVHTPTGEQAMVEVTEQSSRFHYTWQTTQAYRRRFGHWNYRAPYGSAFLFASDGGMVDTAGPQAKVLDEQGDWLAVPAALNAAGTAPVSAYIHPEYYCWSPREREKPRPAAVVTDLETGHAPRSDLASLAEPYRQAIARRFAAITGDGRRRATWPGCSSPWIDEDWEETLRSMGAGDAEVDAIFAAFQAELVRRVALECPLNPEDVPLASAAACERNRQLNDVGDALRRVLRLVYGDPA